MKKYCTYITFYRGNKLPPFYIGSTLSNKIDKGYRGSVRSKQYQQIWESELKDNPNLFKTVILTFHSTHGDALEKEAKFQKLLNATNNPLYTNKSIAKRGFGNLSKESIEIIRQKALNRDYSYMKGKNHHYYGGRTDLDQSGSKNPMARKCSVYGKIFGTIKEAAEYYNLPYKKMYKRIIDPNDNECYKL